MLTIDPDYKMDIDKIEDYYEEPLEDTTDD